MKKSFLIIIFLTVLNWNSHADWYDIDTSSKTLAFSKIAKVNRVSVFILSTHFCGPCKQLKKQLQNENFDMELVDIYYCSLTASAKDKISILNKRNSYLNYKHVDGLTNVFPTVLICSPTTNPIGYIEGNDFDKIKQTIQNSIAGSEYFTKEVVVTDLDSILNRTPTNPDENKQIVMLRDINTGTIQKREIPEQYPKIYKEIKNPKPIEIESDTLNKAKLKIVKNTQLILARRSTILNVIMPNNEKQPINGYVFRIKIINNKDGKRMYSTRREVNNIDDSLFSICIDNNDISDINSSDKKSFINNLRLNKAFFKKNEQYNITIKIFDHTEVLVQEYFKAQKAISGS